MAEPGARNAGAGLLRHVVEVDAFVGDGLRGNPAGVLVLAGPADPVAMQGVARDVGHGATAVLWPEGAEGAWRLRWFSPTDELGLCGHGTLAATHVLRERGRVVGARVRYLTPVGELAVRVSGTEVELGFPQERAEPCPAPAGLAAMLGAPSDAVVAVAANRMDLLVELASEGALRALAPDPAAVAALPVRGVIATSPADDAGYDFASRFFAPAVGIGEDHVCGSAHCALGPWWAERLGRHSLVGLAASARGGVVRVRLEGDRAVLGGRAKARRGRPA